MKKTLLLATIAMIVSFVNQSYGQITITLADLNTVGDSVLNINDTIVPAGTSVGGTGSQTWDFSNLQMDFIDTIVYVDPSTTTNGADFSAATLATDDDGFTAYLQADSAGLNFMGFATDFFGTGAISSLLYEPTQKVMEFPSTSGTAYVDTSAYQLKFAGADVGAPIDSIGVNRTSFFTSTVDAFGAVTTPSGTFQTIRQFTMEVIYDSVMLKDPAFTGGVWALADPTLIGAPNPSIDTVFIYHWYANGEGYPVLEMETDGPGGNVLGANFKLGTQVVAGIVDITNATCFGSCDGAVEATEISGTAPYAYLWDDPSAQSTSVAIGLCPGSYSVTITDAIGGTSTAIATITEPLDLAVALFAVGPACDTCADGWASASVTGGTMPYSYLWNDSAAQTSSSATNLMNGTYAVTVTDANGCLVASDSVVVLGIADVNEKLNIRIYPNPTNGMLYIDQEQRDVQVEVLDLMGRLVLQVDLTNSGAVDLSGLTNGTYYVRINNEEAVSITKKIVLIR
ncbi:MAG: T9SS type A sorting domain-containing protein [Flavobacteriales bacterium]|nr:T9SS type A sorting domain-containing protein [Flavobacteriales bacterium]